MSMFTCELCDDLLDGDFIEAYEWGDGMACIDCHCEATPENFEDWVVRLSGYTDRPFKWEITHKDYDGAPINSFEGPADSRHFYGPTLVDVWQQAIDYEEEQKPLKGLRFQELYDYYRGHKTEEEARREAYHHIKVQNTIYNQSEYYE